MRLLVFLTALILGPPAAAQQYDASPSVTAWREGAVGEARASMDVQAPPETVWAVLSDCGEARRFMRHLLSCRVLERGDGWDVREHRVRGWPLKPVMRNVARVELEPNRRLSFRRIAGDWARSDGEWVLTPIDSGRGTHVEYRLSAALQSAAPALVSRALVVRNLRLTLAALRREAESDAAER